MLEALAHYLHRIEAAYRHRAVTDRAVPAYLRRCAVSFDLPFSAIFIFHEGKLWRARRHINKQRRGEVSPISKGATLHAPRFCLLIRYHNLP